MSCNQQALQYLYRRQAKYARSYQNKPALEQSEYENSGFAFRSMKSTRKVNRRYLPNETSINYDREHPRKPEGIENKNAYIVGGIPGAWHTNIEEKFCFESHFTPAATDCVIALSICSYEFSKAKPVLEEILK